MSQTKIEWCDKTWSPVTGCSPVSDGCKNCYARRFAYRLKGRYGYPKDDPFKVTFHPDRLNEPLHWKKSSRIFISSMGDIFHQDVDGFWLSAVWSIIKRAYWHTFLILTKRPQRWKKLTPPLPIYKNLYFGVSVEDQKTADERIPILLQIPAAKRFVSVEPMLENIDLSIGLRGLQPICKGCYYFKNFGYCAITKYGEKSSFICFDGQVKGRWNVTGLDWVIVGGETGPGARPLHPDWVRSVRDQSQTSGVPFFFKGWGEWGPSFIKGAKEIAVCSVDGQTIPMVKNEEYFRTQAKHQICGGTHQCMYKTGKKKAGRLLDGKIWNEIPETGGDI